MDCIDQDPAMARLRDRVALALVVARAARGGLFEQLRRLPPATADHVAAALGWELAPTRAILQALAAGGLVHHDPELSTWSLGSSGGGAFGLEAIPGGGLGDLLDLAVALGGRSPSPAEPIDRAPVEIFAERILPAERELGAALERGARVVGLAGSEAILSWLALRFPRVETLRLVQASPARPADLILHLSPLVVPESPERWLADVARGLGPAGHLVLRALRRPLTPPSTGRGWWHALAVAAALDGGEGAVWSASMVRRAASFAACGIPRAYDGPGDPDCHHFVLCRQSSSGSASPR